MRPGRRISLRRYLLLGILVPVLAFVLINTISRYQRALAAADTAYDRTLLASAKAIGELLEVSAESGRPRLQSTLVYSALEAFEADNRSRIYFKVTGFAGETVSGFEDLPQPKPQGDEPNLYAALVHFYDDRYRDEPVRMAVLRQPVAGVQGVGMATVQVAETLELRHTLARRVLIDTLWQQALLVALIAGVVVVVVQRATRPVREISQQLQARSAADLSPLAPGDAPRELQPIVDATNAVMLRLSLLLEHQKRFMRDASHQLRTPLAVLKTQVQSAQRGDVPAEQALHEINITVDQATDLANQMLALAKVEQLRQQGLQGEVPRVEWSAIVRGVALDLSALIGARSLDFELDVEPAWVQAHEWALRELARNLLHNAIKFSPEGSHLAVHLKADPAGSSALLTVADSGPGIGTLQRERLFQPFAGGDADSQGPAQTRGAGLGLAICHDIVVSLGGTLQMDNRELGGVIHGLDARVRLPLAAAA